jgi:hypothetical protein
MRFRGAMLSHVEASDIAGTRLFLTLWARQTRSRRDFVVALSDGSARWRSHALVVRDLDEAMTAVEDRCAPLCDPRHPAIHDDEDAATVVDLVEARCRRALQDRTFRELAAEALDHWHALSDVHLASPGAAT